MKTLGFNELPLQLRRRIWKRATKHAGWKNYRERGNGSSMLMEWLSYGYSVDRWIKEVAYLGIKIEGELEADLRALEERGE